MDILPYHTLGVHKWEVMGLEYPLTGQRSPTKDEVKSFMGKLEDKIRGMGVEIIATGVA